MVTSRTIPRSQAAATRLSAQRKRAPIRHDLRGAPLRPGRALLWVAICLLFAAQLMPVGLQAQVSVTGRGRNFVAPVTDAQGRKTVLRGKDFKPAGQGTVEITGMQAETYRGVDKDMIVAAEQCVFDPKLNVASSSGALSIRTADQRFSIEGESFRWQLGDSRLTSKLVISNRVHSLVRKRMITAKAGADPGITPSPATAAQPAPRPVASVSTNQFIDITSDQFEYQGDRAVFRGNVRVRDIEGDLNCGVLAVIFRGDGGSLERIEAEENVVLDQDTTRVLAEKAIYTVAQDQEQVEFLGRAIWQDGERQGSGDQITFDRRKRTVQADQNAYLRLPRGLLGGSGFLSVAPGTAETNKIGAQTSFVEVFADRMVIQLPPTNGPVQQIVAEKNVLIVDPEQGGRALADRAVFEQATGILELTGFPMLETEHRLVTGNTLRFHSLSNVFTAGPEAYVKLPFAAVANLGILPASSTPPAGPSARTNQFIEVWSRELEYGTNLLRFTGGVRANFLEGDLAIGKLTCATLAVRFGAEVESLLAEGAVEFEQFAIVNAPQPVARKVSCEQLEVKFTPEGHLETAIAQQGVTAEQEETQPGGERPIITMLTSEIVTAYFSTATNLVERIVAEQDVVFRQDARTAWGTKAVYTQRTELVELTGQPSAIMPEGRITDADRLIWDRMRARFIGQGKFKSEWKRPAGQAQAASTGAE